jgi:hypothetical protein
LPSQKTLQVLQARESADLNARLIHLRAALGRRRRATDQSQDAGAEGRHPGKPHPGFSGNLPQVVDFVSLRFFWMAGGLRVPATLRTHAPGTIVPSDKYCRGRDNICPLAPQGPTAPGHPQSPFSAQFVCPALPAVPLFPREWRPISPERQRFGVARAATLGRGKGTAPSTRLSTALSFTCLLKHSI